MGWEVIKIWHRNMEDPVYSCGYPWIEHVSPVESFLPKEYWFAFSTGAGAYSDSRGLPGVRQEVAEFILQRDGYPR